MLKPMLINDERAGQLGVAPGWWGVDDRETPVSGPYASREAALVGIEARGMGDDAPTGPVSPDKDRE